MTKLSEGFVEGSFEWWEKELEEDYKGPLQPHPSYDKLFETVWTESDLRKIPDLIALNHEWMERRKKDMLVIQNS